MHGASRGGRESIGRVLFFGIVGVFILAPAVVLHSLPGAKPGTGESRASSPRRAIKQFLMPKQELQSPPAMSPSEKVQVDATSRRELFKVQASPAEVNQKLRAEKVAMPLGTATHMTVSPVLK
eukprot:COSAG02_NODE_99_length_37069_cov_24.910957_7_plen_123_part_00